MKRDHVVSAAIVSIGYDESSATLQVEFDGGDIYDYVDVPIQVYREFFRSESKGRYFSAHLRDRYEYRQREKPR